MPRIQYATTLGKASRSMNTSLYEIPVQTIERETTDLRRYQGQVLLIVNVASKCGFTPQYEGLEALYRHYQDKGFTVLGFPCDQFGHQEPGNEQEIKAFCKLTYDVTFPLFAKVKVNGSNTHPLYDYLKGAKKGFLGSKSIKWNFTKFLVDRNGNVVARFGPKDIPSKLKHRIESLLKPNQ